VAAPGSQKVSGGHLGRKTPTHFVLLLVMCHLRTPESLLLLPTPCLTISQQMYVLGRASCNLFLVLGHCLLFNNNSEIVFNALFLLRGGVMLCLVGGRSGGVLVVSWSSQTCVASQWERGGPRKPAPCLHRILLFCPSPSPRRGCSQSTVPDLGVCLTRVSLSLDTDL